MEKKNILIGVTVVAVVAFIGTVAVVASKQYTKLKSVSAKFGGIEWMGFTDGKVNLRITLLLTNNSDLNLSVKRYNLSVLLNDVLVTPAFYLDNQVIARKSTSPFSFDVSFSPIELGMNALSALSAISDARLKVSGYISGSAEGIPVENFPLNIETKVGDILAKFSGKK